MTKYNFSYGQYFLDSVELLFACLKLSRRSQGECQKGNNSVEKLYCLLKSTVDALDVQQKGPSRMITISRPFLDFWKT